MRYPCQHPRRLEPGLATLALVAALTWTCGRAVAAAPARDRAPTAARSAPAHRPSSAATAPASQVERLTATVRAVDVGSRTLDLLTGVGHALRVRRVHLPPELKVEAGRAESAASALTPGCVVRVECRRTPSGTVASSVVLIQRPGGGKP